jgi:hypothetical protein
MIQLTKNQSNTAYFTLSELTTLEGPYFLFKFTCDQSKVSQYFIAEDESLYPDRYNKFTITETSTPDPLQGEVTLSVAGYYSYEVYEQASSTNLDPEEADNTTPIEVGKVKVIGSADTVYVHNYPDTNIVYNP